MNSKKKKTEKQGDHMDMAEERLTAGCAQVRRMSLSIDQKFRLFERKPGLVRGSGSHLGKLVIQ